MIKKALSVLLCAAAALAGYAGCGRALRLLPPVENAALKAAVLYNGEKNDGGWEDTYSQLSQPLLLNFSVEPVDISKGFALDGFDILYPDESVMRSPAAVDLKAQITRFTEDGGAVFLTNGFYNFFDPGYIGAKDFVRLTECPEALKPADTIPDAAELREIVTDFSRLYPAYADYRRLSQYDYGCGVRTGTAKALLTCGGLALYTLNSYGDGVVLFTNPLLPNTYSINGFSLTSRNDRQASLANTTASANQLFLNAFASYVSKQRYGYAVSRVFGCFGRPSMAWELHYEEITGIRNGSSRIFGELCRQYGQIPSFTVARNPYRWFSRAESVTYLLNRDGGGGLEYAPDLNEGVYSAGTHVVSGGEWLSLCSVDQTECFFDDSAKYGQRAYPAVGDYNNNGAADIITGSADGYIYYCEGRGFDGRFTVGEKQALKDENGRPLSVGGYSSPVLADMNGDKIPDIVSGGSGGKIYWFSGGSGLTFHPEGLLLKTSVKGQTLPEAGDLDGDGVTDLIVGSDEGKLLLFYGAPGKITGFSGHASENLSGLCGGLGAFLAPRLADLNNDGTQDLAVGTADGYIARFLYGGGAWTPDGFFSSAEMNYKGNHNLKFGNNCVPCFADINGDGAPDLVAGALEYGLAYPIDSEFFPYRAALREQLDWMKANDYYVGVHFYTNAYASKTREAWELGAHLKALGSYGVDTAGRGANQHTWITSGLDDAQSFLSIYDAGLRWESGFLPPGSEATPQVAAENVMALPFFLTADGRKTLLMQNCATLLYGDEGWSDISAKYGMPMCLYYHCDLAYKARDKTLTDIRAAEAFRQKHDYSFVTEEQLMYSSAAAYNLDLKTTNGMNAGKGKLDITLKPGALSVDFGLYDEDYQHSCGVKIDFGEAFRGKNIAADADVWRRDGNALYVALNRRVRIYETDERENTTHLERVNIPAVIKKTDGGADVRFLKNGMMQLAVDGRARTSSDGWSVAEQDGKTVFTKFGKAETLKLGF